MAANPNELIICELASGVRLKMTRYECEEKGGRVIVGDTSPVPSKQPPASAARKRKKGKSGRGSKSATGARKATKPRSAGRAKPAGKGTKRRKRR